MTEQPQLFWHFLPDDGMMRFEPRVLVVPGQTLRIDDEPILCERGYHASLRVLDALQYATGSKVQRCTLGGIVLDGWDKHVGQERTCLWMADATRVLHEFACDTAEAMLADAVAMGLVVDPRSRQALAVKRRWLDGLATNDELATARAVAIDIANASAWASDSAFAFVSSVASVASASASAAARAAASAFVFAFVSSAAAARDELNVDQLNADLERRLLTLAPKEAAG